MNYIFYAFRLQVFPSGNKLLPSHVGKATRVVVFRPFVFRHFSIFSLLFLLPFYKLSGLLSCCRDAVLRRLCGIMNWVSESCQVMCMHMKDSFSYVSQYITFRDLTLEYGCPVSLARETVMQFWTMWSLTMIYVKWLTLIIRMIDTGFICSHLELAQNQ